MIATNYSDDCSCCETTTGYCEYHDGHSYTNNYYGYSKQEAEEPKWEIQRCYKERFIKNFKVINPKKQKVNLIRLNHSGSIKDKKINKRKLFLRNIRNELTKRNN